MLWLIIALILLIIAIAMFFMKVENGNDFRYNTDTGHEERVPRYITVRGWSAIPFALFVVVVVMSSVYTQDPGEAIVIKSISGKVVSTDTTPGFGFTAPWNSTIGYDIRNQKIEMFGGAVGSGDRARDFGPAGADGVVITAPLEGSSNAFVSITVRYSIKPDAVREIYEVHRTQENLLANVLRPGLRDVVRAETAKFPPFEVKERRAELSQNIREALEESWGEDGIVVDDVDLGDLSLDPNTEESISKVNTAQAGVEEQRANLEQAYIAAETTKTNAQAQADADQIIRCGATTATETQVVAGKEQEVTVVVPLSGAECENRLNEQVLTSKWFDTLSELGASGNMTILVPEDGTTPIVQLPAPQPQG